MIFLDDQSFINQDDLPLLHLPYDNFYRSGFQ